MFLQFIILCYLFKLCLLLLDYLPTAWTKGSFLLTLLCPDSSHTTSWQMFFFIHKFKVLFLFWVFDSYFAEFWFLFWFLYDSNSESYSLLHCFSIFSFSLYSEFVPCVFTSLSVTLIFLPSIFSSKFVCVFMFTWVFLSLSLVFAFCEFSEGYTVLEVQVLASSTIPQIPVRDNSYQIFLLSPAFCLICVVVFHMPCDF